MAPFSDFSSKVSSARTSLNSRIDEAGKNSGIGVLGGGKKRDQSFNSYKTRPTLSPGLSNDWKPAAPSPVSQTRPTEVTRPTPPPPSRAGQAPPPALPHRTTDDYFAGAAPPAPPPPPPRQPAAGPPALPRRNTEEVAGEDDEPTTSVRSAWQDRDRTQLAAAAKAKPPPPAPRRGLAPPPVAAADSVPEPGFPRFSRFDALDKQAFFDLLDDFFASRSSSEPLPPTVKAFTKAAEEEDLAPPPPPVSLSTRPGATAAASTFAPSHESHAPPASVQPPADGEAVLLARYFSTFRTWSAHSDAWVASQTDPAPAMLVNHPRGVRRNAAWSQRNDARTHLGYALFHDLSQAWYTCTISVARPFPPQSAECRYRPPPGPQDEAELLYGSQLYGEAMAAFAEQAVRSGRHVGRGECWDMAHEALKSCEGLYGAESKPLPSIGRSHGALIWRGRAWAAGAGEGEWVGGDVGNIRRGDVLEWRTAKCYTVSPRLLCVIGDPEHTAVIVADSPCAHLASDPSRAPPSSLGLVATVEQSLHQIPVQRTYDMSTMSEGEAWIYRPMMESRLLGEGVGKAQWPPEGHTLAV